MKFNRKCVFNGFIRNFSLKSLNALMDDNRLVKEFYERTNEQNDELGFNDMKTENYGELETIKEDD